MPINERDNCRLFPTVMPNVAGISEYCIKTYDQIALETLGDYLAATAYDGETVRDRRVQSRAFIDGFEAALFIFKRWGLFQPYSCTGWTRSATVKDECKQRQSQHPEVVANRPRRSS